MIKINIKNHSGQTFEDSTSYRCGSSIGLGRPDSLVSPYLHSHGKFTRFETQRDTGCMH
jgi:hypothetical protein